MTHLRLENDCLLAELHPRGAALARLVYKPLARDIVLGCQDRFAPLHYTNAIVGPIANRVAGGRYFVGNRAIQLDQNEGENCLHGGANGLSELDWNTHHTDTLVEFSLTTNDPHGTSITYTACYALTDQSLQITLGATSAQDFAVNLAPHLYFTLEAPRSDDLTLMINANSYLPIDAEKIPTGQIAPVAKTQFDVRTPAVIGSRAIDHNYCLNNSVPATTLAYDGLEMTLITNTIGLQVYTADHLDRVALALEPQGWPNAVNQPDFPSQIITANTQWSATTTLGFHQTPEK